MVVCFHQMGLVDVMCIGHGINITRKQNNTLQLKPIDKLFVTDTRITGCLLDCCRQALKVVRRDGKFSLSQATCRIRIQWANSAIVVRDQSRRELVGVARHKLNFVLRSRTSLLRWYQMYTNLRVRVHERRAKESVRGDTAPAQRYR